MKKHTIELKRYPNSPIGYGIMHPLDGYKAYEKAIDYCLINDVSYNNHNVRTEYIPYEPDREVVSSGWTSGNIYVSHEHLVDKKEKYKYTVMKFGVNVVYLDIYYNDHDSLLEENIQLKKALKELNEKYNGTINC